MFLHHFSQTEKGKIIFRLTQQHSKIVFWKVKGKRPDAHELLPSLCYEEETKLWSIQLDQSLRNVVNLPAKQNSKWGSGEGRPQLNKNPSGERKGRFGELGNTSRRPHWMEVGRPGSHMTRLYWAEVWPELMGARCSVIFEQQDWLWGVMTHILGHSHSEGSNRSPTPWL